MNFKRKLKARLITGIVFFALGVLMIISAIITKTSNNFVSSFGLALVVIGIARTRKYFTISRSEERIKNLEILETDERNVEIMHKSKSAAFIIYVIVMSVAVIILSFLNMNDVSKWFSLSIFVLVAIYWICYFVNQKRF